jgi:DNA-binding transcriptional ArsR family regulator
MMMEEDQFITISALIGEPARARMLWNLLDGRAYTASELSLVADISATSASNHLAKLLEADLLKVETQGRHRYYSFARHEVAYVVESLASLTGDKVNKAKGNKSEISGIKYCRTCYDHLAGHVGVRITEALETKGLIKKSGGAYNITGKGWKWLSVFGISKKEVTDNRRSLTRQCLDWSERRPHLAGQIGAILLDKMLERRWFKKVQFSRELIITSKGRQEMGDLLAIEV